MNVGSRVLHRVADPSLRGQVHDVREGYDVEELAEEHGVVDVAIDDEHAGAVEEALARALEVGVVVAVEVVEPEDAVTAALEGEGDVRADEARGAGDEHSEARGGGAARGFGDALLPVGAAPGVAKGAAGGGGGRRRREDEEEKDECEKEGGPESELGE